MAQSNASTVRKALRSMGLIKDSDPGQINPHLSEARRQAALKSHEKRRARLEAEKLAKGLQPVEVVQDAKKPVTARDSGELLEQSATVPGAPGVENFAETAVVPAIGASRANLQTIQEANNQEAKRILNDAGVSAAKYLRDLVVGVIDAPERIRLDAAKVILQSQGVTGEQSAQQREKDISAMSKADLMAFIKAGTVELQRLKAAREAEIIDVTPSASDAISDCDPLE